MRSESNFVARGQVLSVLATALKYCVVIITGGFLPSLMIGCVVLLALESAGRPVEFRGARNIF